MKSESKASTLIGKGFKMSLINIWRNKFLSLATIFVIGIIIFIFNIILAINFIATESLQDLSKKIDIVLYLKESTTYSDTQVLIRDIESLDVVDQVVYTSKDDALRQLKQTQPDISLAFEKYDLGNPLPASLSVKTKQPQDHSVVADFLSDNKYQALLSNLVTNEEGTSDSILSSVSKNLSQLSRFTKHIIFWLVLAFVIGGVLIILNALHIAIFERRKEIEVMKLVGASHWFIRFPFMIEAAIYGIFAVIVGFILLSLLSGGIESISSINWTYVFFAELIAAIVLSVLSSMIAVHEHLLKKSL